ncbi:T9SS type A sorting domain-containing protein [Pontimicrobium sp. IMCC45349]|uniref:T9SS type A sorting domain-containing protein n=1 Tax=Pontimicrobium sp. IMCC45349 TaxID=3391574 RepID=UPI0039A3EF73
MKQKYLALLFILYFFTLSTSAQTTYYWRNDQASSASGQWNNSNNWWNGSPNLPGGAEVLYLDGTVGSIMTNDLPSTNRFRIEFHDAGNSRIINGIVENTFYDYGGNNPKIENYSSTNHTIAFPIKIGYNPMEINPINGNLTITSNIDNNGNYLDIYGNNSNQLTVDGIISGTGGIVLKQNSLLEFNSNNVYSGNTNLESGVLVLNGSLINSDITVMNGATLEINSNDITIKSLTVDAGGIVTIKKGNSLIISNNLTNNGTLTLESDSNEFSSLIINGIASGNINYERFTAQVGPTGTNDLVSPPVADQQFGAFATANNGVLAASGDLRAFAPFDKTAPTADYVNYDVTVNNTTTINPGTGYRAGTITGSTLTFNGTVNTASVNVPISHSGNGYEAWNLVGNPYPSYLSLNEFLTENTSELDPSAVAVYGYDGDASDGWHIWNAAYELANPGSLIAPGQGFFVASKTGGGSIDFTTTMRNTGSSDDFIGGDVMNPNFALTSLELTKEANLFNTDIYFIDGQTRGLDAGYDAAAFNNNANIFTALVENNNGVNMAIQALPYNDFNDVVVPLGIKANAGEQVTIGLGNNTIPNTINIYLEDTINNTWTLLNNEDYTFTPSNTLNETGQLYIHFNADTLSNSESTLNNITIYTPNNSNNIIIKGQLLDNTNFSLFDVQGRIVMTKLLDSNNNTNAINISNLSSGIYIAQITSNGINKTQKIIVE